MSMNLKKIYEEIKYKFRKFIEKAKKLNNN